MSTPKNEPRDSILRKPDVIGRVRLSDATLWRREKAGTFPKRFSLGGLAVGWLESEVSQWIAQRASARKKGPDPHEGSR